MATIRGGNIMGQSGEKYGKRNIGGYFPEHSSSNFELSEIIGPDNIEISINVFDFKAFIDSLLSIKDGGSIEFVRFAPRLLKVKVINLEKDSKIKKL